jgi:predicted transcriptional regulator
MSDEFWRNLPQIIVAVGTLLVSLSTLVTALIGVRKIERVHKATNSIVELNRTAALKEGIHQGAAEEKARQEAKA